MSFLIPHPDIELYSTGFPKEDPLSRRDEGQRLSNLVEGIDAPMVVALDGGWGSGKSVFLKYWVGQHTIDFKDTKCVYFDAFANDFMDQPLSGLVAELARRFPKSDQESGPLLDKLRKNAGKITLSAMRIGAAVASSGLSEIVGTGAGRAIDAAADAAIEATAEELEKAAEHFLRAEDAQRSAMEVFRQTLIALTEPRSNGLPRKRVIFVVDELDRCRPDYALSLLEIIKHFFATPGVHFILGINTAAMEASISARYGTDAQAQHYLTKFIDIKMNLPALIDPNKPFSRADIVLFERLVRQMKIPSYFADEIRSHLQFLGVSYRLSLREVEKLMTHAKLLEVSLENQSEEWIRLLVGLLILRTSQPSAFQKLQLDALDHDHLASCIVDEIFQQDVEATWKHYYAEGPADTLPDGFHSIAYENKRMFMDALSMFGLPD